MNQPNPPENLLQRISGNPSAADFVRSFEHVRQEVKAYLREAGFEFRQFRDILDFGCGVGRFLFAFRPELLDHQRLWGCDVFPECAQWCRENIDFAEVVNNSIDPPLPYQEQFDLVYALSVFTHLRLDMQFRWTREIYRVLRPNGVLFATIHGLPFLPLINGAEWGTDQVKEMYSLGGGGVFSYVSAKGSQQDEGQVNVAAAHNAEFIAQQYSAFEVVRRFPQSRMAGGQDLYIFRKPGHGRPIVCPVNGSTDDPAEAAGRWSWPGRASATPNGKESVALTFHVSGQQKFRVYLSIAPDGIYLLDYDVRIEGGGRVLAEKAGPLNNGRVFGHTHYEVIEVDVPEQDGEVKVILGVTVRARGSLAADATAEVRWCFPNFA